MSEFVAEQNPDESFDVKEDGRFIYRDAEDLEDVVYVVRSRKGREVTVIDLDGFTHVERC
jgi:hypothetical protein